MPKRITRRQQRYLFSAGSPLSSTQKTKLAGELRRGTVKIVRKRRGGKKRRR